MGRSVAGVVRILICLLVWLEVWDVTAFSLRPSMCSGWTHGSRGTLCRASVIRTDSWTPNSWETIPNAFQQPEYSNKVAFSSAVEYVRSLPQISTEDSIRELRTQLAAAERGENVVLMGGDCAETLVDRHSAPQRPAQLADTLHAMAATLIANGSPRVVRIGRLAGQFAKPRSELISVNGERSYSGDAINGIALDDRTPDPKRIADVAHCSHHYWHIASVAEQNRNTFPISSTLRSVSMELASHGANSDSIKAFNSLAEKSSKMDLDGGLTGNLYASHEAFLLPLESAWVRKSEQSDNHYSAGGHMLWIGERTRALNSPHVHFASGLSNPIGVKISHKISPDELLSLIDTLNPSNEPGKLSLIVRMGQKVVREKLPPLLQAVKDSGRRVLWLCDPMHGNTISLTKKTRRVEDIVAEISGFIAAHREVGTIPGGLHLEMTGQPELTECLGGSSLPVVDIRLTDKYETLCDPRLNRLQALDVACSFSGLLNTDSH